MVINKQQWEIILEDLELTDKEMIVAEAIKLLLNQAPDPKKIMEDLQITDDEDSISFNKLELADTINAALATVIFTLEDDEPKNPEDPDPDAELRETAYDMIEGIDGYDFVENLGCSIDELINGSNFGEFLVRVAYVVSIS